MRLQTAAINGTYGLSQNDVNKYYGRPHFELVKKVSILRREFRRGKHNIKTRKEIAKEELDHWLSYVEQRKESLQGSKTHWI